VSLAVCELYYFDRFGFTAGRHRYIHLPSRRKVTRKIRYILSIEIRLLYILAWHDEPLVTRKSTIRYLYEHFILGIWIVSVQR
jgi:hypothetical protein